MKRVTSALTGIFILTAPAFTFAATDPTVNVPAVCENLISTPVVHVPYSKIVRQLGIRYLILHMRPDAFKELIQARQDSPHGFLLTATGGRAGTQRFNQSLMPLQDIHGGKKWAHQLMSRNDSIGDGWRSKSAADWDVGILFPVEILDRYHFTITDQSTVDSRRQALGLGRGFAAYTTNEPSLDNFINAMQGATYEPYPWSFNVSRYFEFHLDEGLPLQEAALIWIPAPLINVVMPGSDYPGKGSPLVPRPGQSFQVQISRAVNTITDWSELPKGWTLHAGWPHGLT